MKYHTVRTRNKLLIHVRLWMYLRHNVSKGNLTQNRTLCDSNDIKFKIKRACDDSSLDRGYFVWVLVCG